MIVATSIYLLGVLVYVAAWIWSWRRLPPVIRWAYNHKRAFERTILWPIALISDLIG